MCHASFSLTTSKRGNSTTTRSGKHLRISTSTSSAARGHIQITPLPDKRTMLWALCWCSSLLHVDRVWTGTRFRGADGGTTWKPCIQKEQKGAGDRHPTDGKVWEGPVGRGRCRGYNVPSSCTVLPNTKSHTQKTKRKLSWAFHTQEWTRPWSKLQRVWWTASWMRDRGLRIFNWNASSY